MLIFRANGPVDGFFEHRLSLDGFELGLEILLAGRLGIGPAARFSEVEGGVVCLRTGLTPV